MASMFALFVIRLTGLKQVDGVSRNGEGKTGDAYPPPVTH